MAAKVSLSQQQHTLDNASHFRAGKEMAMAENRQRVHNHLLDTKIYTAVGDTNVLQTRPSSVHFQGYTVGKRYTQKLRIINASSACQRMHIIPPSSQAFRIFYNKQDSLVPGMYLEVVVEFMPKENGYHCDCIKIHTTTEENMIVPIHAYMAMDTSQFPKDIYFKPTLLGEKRTKVVPLKNNAACDFEFQVGFVQRHNAFSLHPTEGLIPAYGQVNINIEFTPREYCTACAKLQLLVSHFNAKPVHCNIIGKSEPGLAKKLKEQEFSLLDGNISDPRCVSPLARSRMKKLPSEKILSDIESKGIVKDGITFPKLLDNHAAVSYVLMQQPGKMKAKDIRNAVQNQQHVDDTTSVMKEAVFQHHVHQTVSEEERNQLRWCVKLGEESLTSSSEISKERDKHVEDYNVGVGDSRVEKDLNRSTTGRFDDRVHRVANVEHCSSPTFDLFLNDEWHTRHLISERFVQSARKVMIRTRAARNIKAMTGHLQNWQKGNFASSGTRRNPYSDLEQKIVENVRTDFDPNSIRPFSFPEYVDPEKKDDMALDALGVLPTGHIFVKNEMHTSVYDLIVPQEYKLLGYKPHSTLNNVRKYIPKNLSRPLRVGAEDELTDISSDMNEISPETPSVFSRAADDRAVSVDLEDNATSTGPVQMVPQSFLQPREYHPMHIFNPCPGLLPHPQQMPYSEVDEDFRLCPIPRGNQGKKLDHNDVISGAMHWKKFPNQSMLTSNGPTLSTVHLPRWSDSFSDDLLPSSMPTLLDELPEDDVIPMELDESDESHVPTMEMIEAEFKISNLLAPSKPNEITTEPKLMTLIPLITNHNLHPMGSLMTRAERIKDLDTYLQNKSNELGARIQTNIEHMKNMGKNNGK